MDIPSGGVEALDELLDLPHLNVLLCWILTHFDEENRATRRLLYRKRGPGREGKGKKSGGRGDDPECS